METIEIQSIIWHCLFRHNRLVVRSPRRNSKAVLDSGCYIVKTDGKYVVQPYREEKAIMEIFSRLIEKYERFEYDGFAYFKGEHEEWIRNKL